MSLLTFQSLMDKLNELYPPKLAEDWDQVGLHFGAPQAPVKKIMTTLDVRHEVVDEAITENIDTLIVHHPLLFKPIQRFDLSIRQNQLYEKLIKNDIKVFALHTNLDIAHNGMNDWLAEELGLIKIRLLNKQVTEESPGLGRIGEFTKPIERQALIDLLKHIYMRTELPIIERIPKETYQTVAIIGGSGTSFFNELCSEKIDVFLTGDITYHTAQLFEDTDFMTVDVGHYSEVIFAKKMNEVLMQLIQEEHWNITTQATTKQINPFKYE